MSDSGTSKPYLVSPSQFRAHKDCTQLHKYVYGMNLRPVGENRKMAKGTYFHELAHFYYQLIKSGYEIGSPHTLAAMDTKLSNDLQDIDAQYAGVVLAVHLMFRRYLERRTKEIDQGIEIIEVEKKLEYVFPGTTHGIQGIADLIYRNKITKKLTLRDHKTGENQNAYSDEALLYEDQLMTYAVLLWLETGEVPSIEISWINAKVDYKTPPTNDQLFRMYRKELTKDLLEAWWTYLQEYVYYMRTVPVIRSMNAWKCKKCDFRDPCLFEMKGLDAGNILKANFIEVPRGYDYAKFTEIARKKTTGDSADRVSNGETTGRNFSINLSRRS